MTYYMPIPEAARLWDIAPDALRRDCEKHRVPGAVRFGYRWLIPENARCPYSPVHYGEDSASA